MASDLVELLLPQWQSSPRLRGIVADVLMPLRDEVLTALDRLDLMRSVDDAEGVWLDALGLRLGIRRPYTSNPLVDRRFGFGTAGEPFDQVPFRGDAANDAVYPLPDTSYRRLVKARARLVLGDGTLATFTRAVREIDPDATVEDLRTMRVRVTTADGALLMIADTARALPRSAGVALDIEAP